MRVADVMTPYPATCRASESLVDAAKKMVEFDCGMLPVLVVEDGLSRLAGVITDRDISCRAVAVERDPSKTTVEQCMSSPAITIDQDASIEDCLEQMESHKIRRILVLDAEGALAGVVAIADLAQALRPEEVGELARQVSEPGAGPSQLQ